MPKRQKLDKIEAKAKHVYKVDSWHDPAKLLDDEDMGRKVLHVMKCIENGSPLPDGYYRKGIGRTGDTLLETDGIMHLHLGKSDTSELLYLIQYPDHVVLLELGDHAHFGTKPIGARLRSRHSVAVARKQKELLANPVAPKQPLIKPRRRVLRPKGETAAPKEK